MAKYARNRGMMFASWTGTSIDASAVATVSGTGITAATVTASTFSTAVVGASGAYEFSYDATTEAWKLSGTTITLNN